MRKLNFFISVSFSLLIASCSSPSINVEDLKNQIRAEIESEKEQAKPSTTTQEAITLIEPTPIPYELPERTKNLALDALDELFALGSKTKSGINKTNYSEAVSDARVAYDKFLRSEDSEKHPSKADMAEAMIDYEYAKDVWNCYTTTEESSNNFLGGTCLIYAQTINSEYGVEYQEIGSRKLMYLPYALSGIWDHAAKNVDKADSKKNSPANLSVSSESETSSIPETTNAIASSNPETTSATEEKSVNSNLVEIWGIVQSARGDILPDATVIIQSSDNNHPYKKKFTTDSSGKYTASDLPPNISVKIFAQKPEGGFQTCYMLQTSETNTGMSGARADFTLPATYCP